MDKPYNCNWSEFDLDQHIKTYPYYTEVIIEPDGKIHYAHPSHQEYLINYEAKKRNMSRREFLEQVPWTFTDELVDMTGCVSVWYDSFMAPNKVTEDQLNRIDILYNSGAICWSSIDLLTKKGF